MAVQTLMEVVENSKNIEICVIKADNQQEMLEDDVVDKIVKEIEKEREEAKK